MACASGVNRLAAARAALSFFRRLRAALLNGKQLLHDSGRQRVQQSQQQPQKRTSAPKTHAPINGMRGGCLSPGGGGCIGGIGGMGGGGDGAA